MPYVGEDRTPPQSGQRVTVDEAARALGLSVDAVRKRVQRGQIAYEKDSAGRVRIILDESETLRDTVQDQPQSQALISRLEDEVRFLREELARKDAILLRMAESIPQLEAPSEPPGGPETATEGTSDSTGRADAQEGVQRPWWRRWFGA